MARQPPRPGPDRPSNRSRRLARDIEFTKADRDALLIALADVAADEPTIRWLLTTIDFPDGDLRIGSTTSRVAWSAIYRDLGKGIIATPYRRLLTAAHDNWPYNPTFVELHHTYLVKHPQEPGAPAVGGHSRHHRPPNRRAG